MHICVQHMVSYKENSLPISNTKHSVWSVCVCVCVNSGQIA